MDQVHIYVSGYARQNNGEAGIGICFCSKPNSKPFYEEAEHVGIETQNTAVYRAIKKALDKAAGWNLQSVTIYSDNRLVVGQLKENMLARTPNIMVLYEEVKEASSCMAEFEIKYVPSVFNKRSKDLAKTASMADPSMLASQAIKVEVGPGISGVVLAFSPKLMIVQFNYKKGSKIERHSHVHEQGSYVVKGSLKYVVAEKDIVMLKGSALVVTSNSPHSIEALEDTVEISTYTPMRADLLKLS